MIVPHEVSIASVSPSGAAGGSVYVFGFTSGGTPVLQLASPPAAAVAVSAAVVSGAVVAAAVVAASLAAGALVLVVSSLLPQAASASAAQSAVRESFSGPKSPPE